MPFIVEQTIIQGLFGTFSHQIRQRFHELPNVSISSGDMGRGRTISCKNTLRMLLGTNTQNQIFGKCIMELNPKGWLIDTP